MTLRTDPSTLATIQSWLRGREADWLSSLEQLVRSESPSGDREAIRACALVVERLARRELASVEIEAAEVEEVPQLTMRFGSGEAPAVLLLAHLDTVWAHGAFDPVFQLSQGKVTGAGAFDMKGGIVCAIAALAAIEAAAVPIGPTTLLLTGDEEVGSRTSRPAIEAAALRHAAVLVLEAPVGLAVKTSRKGVGSYRLEMQGRAAHAGLDPEKGINAVIELARLVDQVAGLARPEIGTTVTPAVIAGGTRTNVVPAKAWLEVDVRFRTVAEAERVEREIRELRPQHPEAVLSISGGPNRPPLEESASQALAVIAQEVAHGLGWAELEQASAGGGSDGNFTAALGVPTLDGMGVVGGNAHAQGEWMEVSSIAERAALLAGLLMEIWGGRL